MVKFILETPNIIESTPTSIKCDPNNPTIVEVVTPEGETKKCWKVKGKYYSKKTGIEKERGIGQGQKHAYRVGRLFEIIESNDVYYRTEGATNFLYRKDNLKKEVCKSVAGLDMNRFMMTLNYTKPKID